MQLYGDIFFFYNLVMDYIVLKMTALLWDSRQHGLFLWCVGANILYLLTVIFIGLYPILPCMFLALAVIFALRPKGILKFVGMILTTYLLTFMLGSLSLGLTAVFNADFPCVIIPGLLMLSALKKINKSVHLSRISGLYPLEISTGGKTIYLSALCDSGNGLQINGKPVIIIDSRAAQPLLPYITECFSHTCRTVTGTDELTCFYAQAKIGKKIMEKACVALSATPMDGDFDSLINSAIAAEV